jgi:hypothetical protein
MRVRQFSVALALIGIGIGIGATLRFPPARAAAPTPEQLLSELRALQSRLGTVEEQVRRSAGAPPARTPDPALAALQAQVDLLAKAVQVTSAGLTLSSAGTLNIEAQGALRVKAGGNLQLEAAALNASATGTTAIQGAQIRLNNGARAVAFAGAKTAGSSTTQIIAEGSSTVLVP